MLLDCRGIFSEMGQLVQKVVIHPIPIFSRNEWTSSSPLSYGIGKVFFFFFFFHFQV